MNLQNSIEKEIDDYVDGVVSGKTVAGKYEILACKRYLNDIEMRYDRGYTFDKAKATRVIKYIQLLNHTKGKWAGTKFILEPWQKFIIWNLFGWYRSDGTRRFRIAYTDVARKNGKTQLSAGIGLYMLHADGESRAEVYSAATKRDQAKICFEDAKAIVQNTNLKDKLEIYTHAIVHEFSGSKFVPLSSDYNKQDGFSPSCALLDEFHAHKDSGMYDILRSGMGARKSPLLSIITTAGTNKSGPCYDLRENIKKILEGIVSEESTFGMIFSLDDPSEINDPECWRKANPNIGVSVNVDFLKERLEEAKNRKSAYNDVMTKNFNMWMNATSVWITDEAWMSSVTTTALESLLGKRCWGGLDLSNVSDITAFVLLFNENGRLQIVPRFWIPEEKLKEKVEKENINYDVWQREGYITVIPGNVIDYDFVQQEINNLRAIYNIEAIPYDRWNSSQTIIDMTNDGLNMVPFGQGFASMSTPSKEFEKKVALKQIEHFDNPVLRWMLSNTSTLTDAAGNIKPDKKNAKQKIDGIVATIMALGEWLNSLSEDQKNPYLTRGMR